MLRKYVFSGWIPFLQKFLCCDELQEKYIFLDKLSRTVSKRQWSFCDTCIIPALMPLRFGCSQVMHVVSSKSKSRAAQVMSMTIVSCLAMSRIQWPWLTGFIWKMPGAWPLIDWWLGTHQIHCQDSLLGVGMTVWHEMHTLESAPSQRGEHAGTRVLTNSLGWLWIARRLHPPWNKADWLNG